MIKAKTKEKTKRSTSPAISQNKTAEQIELTKQCSKQNNNRQVYTSCQKTEKKTNKKHKNNNKIHCPNMSQYH